MKTNMHQGASGTIFANARNLRRHPTPAEAALWEQLRNSQTGYKYRRQHPLFGYVVNFYSHALKLVIELDGGNSKQTEVFEKQKALEVLGLTVVRFTNEEVLSCTAQVMKQIYLMQDLLSNQRML